MIFLLNFLWGCTLARLEFLVASAQTLRANVLRAHGAGGNLVVHKSLEAGRKLPFRCRLSAERGAGAVVIGRSSNDGRGGVVHPALTPSKLDVLPANRWYALVLGCRG